ncbi:TolC family protein [Uruburuella testudinis]|uniref:TolC family protein n=1 Tax=Uruburuella testudinis TaxID=1282863 RepID=A0ABY4DVH0_9NEIS|nr:TolC family protein [Uruburuella testudinis]UOO83020.1 TolC family protein [Uruburuella testudinis]
MKTCLKTLSFSLIAAFALAACQNTTVPLDSQIEVPQQFSQAEAASGSAQIGRWWQHWHDPVLSALIEQGLQQSHDVQIAVSRLNEARATSRMARADLGPQAGLSGSAGIMRGELENPLSESARNVLGQFPPTAGMADSRQDIKGNSLIGGISASWEPDIFGAKRSDADAARYAALGAQEQLYGAQMLVAGDIAENYFKARAAAVRLENAGRTVATLARMQQYVQGRFQAGHVTAYEVGDVQSKLSAVKAKQSTIQSEYDAYVRSIAVLVGQVPQRFTLPESSVDVLARPPAAPSGQTPQGMLERRPDIRARAAQVNAYAAKLASAKADLLPRFSINFLGQGGRIEIDSDAPALKGWGSLLSLGIQMPIFTNGRIKANIAASDARLQTALLQYDQTVLQALSEVDSAYQSQHALSRQNALMRQAHRQADKQAADAQKLFRYGDKTLDDALTARLNEEEMADNLVQSQLANAQMLLNLYKALGGGWQE